MSDQNSAQSVSDDYEEIERLKRELSEAIEDEKDAASRAASLIEELEDLGVDTRALDTRL